MMRPITGQVPIFILACFVADAARAQQGEELVARYRDQAEQRWEQDIRQLEQLDQTEQHPANAILFIGSSSIRRWETMAEDMAPWPTIRRGYGGARFSDLAVFVDRLVHPHQFAALAIFVGNDIAGTEQDKSAEEVLALYKYVVERVRVKHPDKPIFFIAVTPTSSRFHVWPKVQAMHQLVRAHCEMQDNLYFVETAAAFLDVDGKPKDELFVEDRLHLNQEGYRVWAAIIKRQLERVLGSP